VNEEQQNKNKIWKKRKGRGIHSGKRKKHIGEMELCGSKMVGLVVWGIVSSIKRWVLTCQLSISGK
jgi:hypothetical protein